MAQHLEALKEYRRLRVELLRAIDGQRVADMAVGISDEPYAGHPRTGRARSSGVSERRLRCLMHLQKRIGADRR